MALPGIQEGSISFTDGTSYLFCLAFPSHHWFFLPLPHPHIQQSFFCCWITTLKEEWALWSLFHPGDTHNTHVVSTNSFNSQAPQRGYTTTWLCRWLTDFWWVFIYVRHSCFHIKLSPHRWNICSSAEKEAIKEQQKPVTIGCCCGMCFLCGTCFLVSCLTLLHSKQHLSHLSPPAPILRTTTIPSDLRGIYISTMKGSLFLWTWHPWPLMFNILEIL